MTQLSDKEHNVQMEDMKSFDEQMPCVGFRAQAKHLDTKFKGDYTQVPRGRVAWTIDKFIVLVGKWAEPIQKQLTELLEQEFSLPYFEFVYDEHWDLGHGWSGDMPK